MAPAATIGIIGDFNPQNQTHLATNSGIEHAARSLGVPLRYEWLPTDAPHDYRQFQALFCSPGSPYKSLEGALAGIRYARENGVPFLGTCGGFQHLILEYARNVLGIAEAAHAETDPYASILFITPLSCSLVGKTMHVIVEPGTRAASAYRAAHAEEHFYCNFGLNPAYTADLVTHGLEISGKDDTGETRIMELAAHPFFMGTLFVPQARSERGRPHPLVLEFCRAAMQTPAAQ